MKFQLSFVNLTASQESFAQSITIPPQGDDFDSIRKEYAEMRASFIMQYASELLGEYATMPQLKSESIEDIKEHIKQIEVRKQKAMEIPITEFDIDFHNTGITKVVFYQKGTNKYGDIVFEKIDDTAHYMIEG